MRSLIRHCCAMRYRSVMVLVVIMVWGILLIQPAPAQIEEMLVAGYFSNDRLVSAMPPEWNPFTFPQDPQAHQVPHGHRQRSESC